MTTKSPHRWLATTLALAAMSGCYQPVSTAPHAGTGLASAPRALPKAGPQRVAIDGGFVYSTEENRPSPDEFLAAARRLVASGEANLLPFLQKWPDAALDLLRDSIAADADVSYRLAIAQAYDRAFGAAATDGWYNALATAATPRQVYLPFRSAREQILSLLNSGRADQAAGINVSSALPSDAPPAVQAESLRVQGLVALLNGKNDRAADLLSRARAVAEKGPRHVSFDINLLLSMAHSRAGHAAAATEAWKAALAAGANIHDPQLWERSLLIKPASTDWPAAALLAHSGEPRFAPTLDGADVLIAIGKMRLSRRAYQPALLSFSRAEGETAVDGKKALARLYRAQSMIALQQGASALPMLETLSKNPDARISTRAKLVQGDLLCRLLNDRERGIALMHESLDHPDAAAWPGQAQLAANLALYEILEGRDEEGLRRLHEAQSTFAANSQWDDLANSLTNEAAFLRFAGRQGEAEAIQRRAEEVSQKAGLAI